MSQSRITVTRNGRPVSGIRVVLGFWGGHTPGHYSDSNGIAIIPHAHTGEATLFADGKEIKKVYTPCDTDAPI